MPAANLTTNLALLLWIPIGLLLTSSWSAQKASLFIMIGGALFLPQLVGFDLPILPPLGKNAIALLTIWLGCKLNKPASLAPERHLPAAGWLAVAIFASSVLTAMTNTDALRYGPVVKKAMEPYDGVVMGIDNMIFLALPFYLGSRLFRTPDDLRYLLRGIVVGTLVYVPFVLLEARLSPFFHKWLYGFFQHDWTQARREGGFRAFVFMSHALSVAFFMATGLVAVTGLSRLKQQVLPGSPKLLGVILAGTLVACKSLASLTYALVAAPILLFTSTTAQMRIARYLAIFVLAYPLARLWHLVPLEWFVDRAIEVDPARAESLAFRFHHEVALLEKAGERLWLGWGGWGRNRSFNEETGLNVSVVDGQWIVDFGSGGLVRYFLIFGALLLPVLAASRTLPRLARDSDDARTLAIAAFLLALTGVDLLPNSLSHPIPIFLAGALTTVARGLRLPTAPAARPSSDGPGQAVRRSA